MTEPIMSVSNSEIQTFLDCRRRWYLSYVRGLKRREEKMTGPLALGSRIHLALENYYRTPGADLLDEWARLVEVDRLKLQSEFRDETDFDNEAELGRIMLEGYLQWNSEEGIDSDYDITSSEERLSATLLDGKVELKGKIDQRVRRKTDGVRLVRDFKTSANFTDITKMLHMNEQFLTYMTLEAMQRDEKDRVEGGLVTLLKKVKRTTSARPPFYEQIEVRFNIFMLRNFWSKLHGRLTEMLNVYQALENGADHQVVAYPRPTRDCTWKCEYNAICPMFDDGSAVEAAIEVGYKPGDPYEYYRETPGS